MFTVYVGGTFDLGHFGHIEFLRKAKSVGEGNARRLVVAVNRDEFVTRFKRKPILSLEERMRTVQSWQIADEVVINETNEDSKPMLLKYKAKYIVYGSDYTEEKYKKQIGVTDEWLEKHDMFLVQFENPKEISTTKIIQRCKDA